MSLCLGLPEPERPFWPRQSLPVAAQHSSMSPQAAWPLNGKANHRRWSASSSKWPSTMPLPLSSLMKLMPWAVKERMGRTNRTVKSKLSCLSRWMEPLAARTMQTSSLLCWPPPTGHGTSMRPYDEGCRKEYIFPCPQRRAERSW